MPYITCPDGKTYSRYDQSDYVKWCICNEKSLQQKKFNVCMADPKCRAEYEWKKASEPYFIWFCVVLIITFFVLFVRHLDQSTKK
jgi:hypothetical protein